VERERIHSDELDDLEQLVLDTRMRGFSSASASISDVIALCTRRDPPLDPRELIESFNLWLQAASTERHLSRTLAPPPALEHEAETWLYDNAFYGAVALRVCKVLITRLRSHGIAFDGEIW